MEIASEKYLAFLDSKTIPNRNWLSSSFPMLKDYDVVLGSVHYIGVGKYQKLISASIYGEDSIEHISGTLLSKTVFLNIGFFNEKFRAGEDLDWKTRLKESEFNYYFPAKANSVYSEISSNLIFHVKRAFIYQMHSAFLDIQYSTRVLYLSVFLILLATLVPNWNNIVWHYNYELFVPNITKFFLFFLGLFIFIGFIYLRIFGYFRQRRPLMFLMNLSLFIWLFVVAYNWNSAIPAWNESSPFFVPHITKLYLLGLLVLSFITRGIVFPIKRKVHNKYLFPYRWVIIGIIGLILDISKSPGYFMGALIVVYKKVKSYLKREKINIKE